MKYRFCLQPIMEGGPFVFRGDRIAIADTDGPGGPLIGGTVSSMTAPIGAGM